MGGSSQPTTQTTQTVLSPEQRQLLDLAMPSARQFAANPPQLPGFSGVPGMDPLQTQGQEAVLGSVPGQSGVVGSAASGTNFLTSGDVLRPENNPALQGTINASVRPIYENLTQSVLPTIRTGAATTGQFGGSRQGIAEGLATQGASRAAGETASKVANQGYQTGLDAMTKGIGLAPTTANALTIPGLTTSGVGDVRQNLVRELLGEQIGRWNFQQMAPLLTAQQLAGLVAGIPGGGTTTTASGPQPNRLTGTLGGAAAGASLGATLGSVVPGIGTGLGALGGGGLGALLPWLVR